MKDWQRAASAANIIGYFLARRDIDELSTEAMQARSENRRRTCSLRSAG